MIKSLRIINYALIRNLELHPAAGFNIITGETGAGKSIIMGALALLKGKRADARGYVQEERSVVEAVFSISDDIVKSINGILDEAGVPVVEGNELTLRREIRPTGRSKATVNGTQVQLAVLGDVADRLVDIHSQHKNLLLTDPDFQLEVLDNLADNHALLEDYKKIYADYRVALRRFADTREEILRTSSDADYLEYQLNELNSVELAEGEEEELERQRNAMANASAISEKLSMAASMLTWNESSASELVTSAISAMNDAAEMSDEYAPLATRLEAVLTELDDVADTVAEHAASMQSDPATLDEIEKRLNKIYSLKTKHRVASVEQLIEIRDRIQGQLAAMNDSESLLKNLENAARMLKKQALEKANVLSSRRKTAATELVKLLTERARPLGMANLNADVRVTSGKLNPSGIDTVEFLFAFNKNQETAPIGSRASGGEISRVMLALKSITAEHNHLPTIIFDEIDTGVSGDVAKRMGALMDEIGHHMQVVTITHLPQVAARGERHFKVYKVDEADSTHTHIAMLDHERRRSELALMLSGNPEDPTALAAAEQLLNK